MQVFLLTDPDCSWEQSRSVNMGVRVMSKATGWLQLQVAGLLFCCAVGFLTQNENWGAGALIFIFSILFRK